MKRTINLTSQEAALWVALQTFSTSTLARVAHEVFADTGLSSADFSVLASLMDLGNGVLRQRELAMALDWDKSRISHHLNRMQERKLLMRSKTVENGSRVELTAFGRKAYAQASPIHAQAVRRHFLERVTAEQSVALLSLAQQQ